MRKNVRKTAGFLAMLLVFLLLAACGKKEIDAEKAVDAYLRAETKGEFEDYAKLVGEDEEDLKEEYEEKLDELTEVFNEAESLGMDFGDGITEEIKNVLASAKYEITGSEKDEDGNYTVDVNVYPSNVLSLFFEKVMEAAQNVNDISETGETLTQALKDAIAEQSYGEAVAYEVHITYDEENKQYEISEDDINAMIESFFEFDGGINSLYEPSGTVYDNPYFNWTKTEWDAASDEEKAYCCLAIVQEVQGLTDEEMALIDINDESVQPAIEQMKEGLDMSFSSGTGISVGDFTEILKTQMGIE